MSQPDEIGKLFVGGLSWETTQASLLTYFSRFGEVTDCVIITNPSTGKSRGFGFVTFKDPAAVETVQAGGPHMLDGKQIDPNGCNRKKVPKGSRAGIESSKRKLFVGGLPSNIDEAQLKEGFSSYGKIQEVVIVYDQLKQKPRGFGFVTFESEESVEKIVKERFVLLNGKQVECKRAEAREPVHNHPPVPEQGNMIMLSDGSVGLLSQQSYPQQPSSLLTPTELASAYRGAYSNEVGHVLGSGLPVVGGLGAGGVKLLTQGQPTQPQYMVVGGGGGGGGGYLVQGGGGGGGYLVQGGGGLPQGGMVLNQANPYAGLMMSGAQNAAGNGGSVLIAAPGGGYQLVQTPVTPSPQHGNYILPGAATPTATNNPSGILLQQHQQAQQATQYLMHYPQGTTLLQPSLDPYAGSTLTASAHHPFMPHPELGGALLGDGGEKMMGASSLYAQPYQVINPYASATLLNGGAGDAGVDDGRNTNKQKETSSPSSSSSTSSTPSIPHPSIPKMGYRILPYQSAAHLTGYSGNPHYASPMVADPLISPYARVASTHAPAKFHPYRR